MSIRSRFKQLTKYQLEALDAIYENFGEPDFPWFTKFDFALCKPGRTWNKDPDRTLNRFVRNYMLIRDGDLYRISDMTKQEMLRRTSNFSRKKIWEMFQER